MPPPHRLHLITKPHKRHERMGIYCLQAHEEGQRSSSSSAGGGAAVGATLRSMQLRGEVHHIELVLDMADRSAPLHNLLGQPCKPCWLLCWGPIRPPLLLLSPYWP